VQADIISISHPRPTRTIDPPLGGVAREFMNGLDDDGGLSQRWIDMVPLDYIWRHMNDPLPDWPVPPIIGFHGYRKHINFRDPMAEHGHQLARGWDAVSLTQFLSYQEWLANDLTGTMLDKMLDGYDVLTVEPFDCSYNQNMREDFIRSRSFNDWQTFEYAMRLKGEFNFETPFIRPMHFVCRRPVFCRWMRFFNEMKVLEFVIDSEDAVALDYPRRALGYLAERMWSLWLDASGLKIKTLPLMICWNVP